MENQVTTTGKTQMGGGINETEQRDGDQNFIVGERCAALKRSTVNRTEDIDGNRINLHFAQGKRHFDALSHGLAHTENAATTYFHADRLSFAVEAETTIERKDVSNQAYKGTVTFRF